ncbi:MAG: glycosyltransferase family 4 protein [Phenylobacterium sp.]
MARGKTPGRMLLLATSGAWLPELEQGLGSIAAPALGLAGYVRAGPDPAAQPRALFDQAWYLDRATGLAGSRWPPLAHYLTLGDAAGLSPHPLFDARRYRARHGEALAATGLTALQHFLAHGAAQGADPHPLFDVKHYIGQSDSLADSGENPLVHYLAGGWREGLEPHPMFDGAWYLARYPQAAQAAIAPLLHYVTAGAREGFDPHPLFDTAWRRAQGVGWARGGDPLSDLLLGRGQKSPTPHFDPAHYLRAAGSSPAARANPLLHYLTVGTYEGFSPASGFDEAAHVADDPEAPRSGLERMARALPPEHRPTPPSRPEPAPVAGPRRRRPPSAGIEVTVVGYPFAPTGMGEHGRSTVRALRAVGVEPRIVDVGPAGPRDPDLEREFAADLAGGLGGVNIFCVNADESARAVERLGRPAFDAAYNIAYPAWELARYPAAWAKVLTEFDELWAFSAFVRDALAEAVPRPVFKIPLAVELQRSRILDRAWFDIPEEAFAVLFFFDFASYAARKNPQAVLDAFELLVRRRPEAPLHLVIKTRGEPASPAERRAFDARVARLDDGVQVIDADLSDNEIKNLVAACDVFVSLHRSEGFGRGMAEAMALGRPAVATGYSGNLEFMTPETSRLVDYTLVPVPRGAYPHSEGQVWADASPEHAAALIEALLDDPAATRALGDRARRHIEVNFSNRAVGRLALARLRAITRP